jgi:hypothetical protein
MNAREVRLCVSGYEGRGKDETGSVMYHTLKSVRRILGASSVMEFACATRCASLSRARRDEPQEHKLRSCSSHTVSCAFFREQSAAN